MTVVAGRLGLQFAGEQPRYAGPGETKTHQSRSFLKGVCP